jgi:anti-anti-sigma factor
MDPPSPSIETGVLVPNSSLSPNGGSPSSRPLTIRSWWSGHQRVIALAGEFDVAGADAVQRELIGAERCGARCITLDLRELSFIDCSGIRVIFAAHRRAAKRLIIVNGPPRVRRVFALCDLDARMTFVDELPPNTGLGPPTSAGTHRAGQPRSERQSSSIPVRSRGRPRPVR